VQTLVGNFKKKLIIGIISFITATALPGAAVAKPSDQTFSFLPRYKKFDNEWGGHFKAYGSALFYDDNTLFDTVDDSTYIDNNTDFRLKNKLFFSRNFFFETHYEAIRSEGDTIRNQVELLTLFPPSFDKDLLINAPIDDKKRLFDLTSTIDDADSYTLYHRLDRFLITLQPDWGAVCIGRQAQTWGNGLLFNPMDLFNPFAPADVDRDYKLGDDMVSVHLNTGSIGDIQLLYVPRRDPDTLDIESDQASLGGKIHFTSGTLEFDIMLARHYRENVAGFGSTGYLGDTAFRIDVLWTSLREKKGDNGSVAVVANIDYSWIWMGMNMYGLVELYFNDLGTDDYDEAIFDSEIIRRIKRGEMFTLGRTYLSCRLQVELHPLFNLHLTVINNIKDPSGIIQPRAVWDISQNLQITAGANLYYGTKGTEFGGFEIPQTDLLATPPDAAYLWFTRFF
jgi:hypothetical protein